MQIKDIGKVKIIMEQMESNGFSEVRLTHNQPNEWWFSAVDSCKKDIALKYLKDIRRVYWSFFEDDEPLSYNFAFDCSFD
ncbi:hypothetical protein V7158_01910 [Priestia megaterium]|uniref:hypothetical protein n=1 Tax=Priestia megaterium TaxID=1404 RepID=UPI002FFE8BFE